MPLEGRLEVRLHDRIAEIAEASWSALLTPDSSPFLEWAWLDALEESGCVSPKRGWLPRHITVWRNEALVAAAPAYLKGNSEGEFVFDHQWAAVAERLRVKYYPKLILAVPFTPATGDRVLVAPGEDRDAVRAVVAEVTSRVTEELELSTAHLLFPRPDDQQIFENRGWVPRLGVQFHWHNHGYQTFDDFLSTLGAKKKHQIRRERRLVQELGIVVETLRGEAIDDRILAHAYQFYLATVDKFAWGRRYLNEHFFRLMRDRWSASGQLEVVVARKGDQLIGGAINIAKNKRLYGRYWGALEEVANLHFEVCYYHSISDCIARGFEAFEPGAGGEHKARRGFDPTVTTSAHLIRDSRLDAIVREYLGRERDHVRKVVSGELSEDD
ncbi:MAG: GNAT family N-acetyltransferase [Polyangiales bacterium]